jgi:hypothetical protein
LLPHRFRLRRPGDVVPNHYERSESRHHRADISEQSDKHDKFRAHDVPGVQLESLDAANRVSFQRGPQEAVPHNDFVWFSAPRMANAIFPIPIRRQNGTSLGDCSETRQ